MEILIFHKNDREAEEWLELHDNGELAYTIHKHGRREPEHKTLSAKEARQRWPEWAAKIEQGLKDIAGQSS